MDSFWNQMDIPLPVILSITLDCENPHKVVKSLKLKVRDCRNSFQYLSQLDLEAATLSRLIYRMKQKFRQEKCFKYLQMINRCLSNYKTMHLPFTLTSIDDTLFNNQGPSRQMLEWLLVRLYGAAKLFHRVNLLCVECVGHVIAKLKLETMWDIQVFCLAVVSRTWVMAQYVVRKSCEWFNILHDFLDKLPSSATPWLPEGCSLPSDLNQMLENAPYLRVKTKIEPKDILTHVDESNISETQKNELNKKVFSLVDIDLSDDIGEKISRNHHETGPNSSNQFNNRNQLKANKKERTFVAGSFVKGNNFVKPVLNDVLTGKTKIKNKLKKKRLKEMHKSGTKFNSSKNRLKSKQ